MENIKQKVTNRTVANGTSVTMSSVMETTVTFETEDQAQEFNEMQQCILIKRDEIRVAEEQLAILQDELTDLEAEAGAALGQLNQGEEDEPRECCGCGDPHCDMN